MSGALALCGGTGAHTGLALLRLHTLGYALGFFDQGDKPFDFPTIYLVDQDSSDGSDRKETAWQLVQRLVAEHPARQGWFRATGRPEGPELVQATPLPLGPNRTWYQKPYNTLESRFESSPYLPLLTSRSQRQIDYSRGMMGSPAVGSMLFHLKSHDERGQRLNHDELYGQLLEEQGRTVVAGSGVGGTGAAVGPTLAQQMVSRRPGQVMGVMILNWFELDEETGDEETRERAARRNRLMRENANSALQFYGGQLSNAVATVPVGMPERSLLKRAFAGDVRQPVEESFIHAVGALCALRHFLADKPYDPGLYIMGAVERGRLDGRTAIPGGTLQGLANQGATLARTLDAFARVFSAGHANSRVRPAIYEAVAQVHGSPSQIGDLLRDEVENYRKNLRWMEEILDVKPESKGDFTYEASSRERLGDGRRGLRVTADHSAEEIVSALFHWTADWVREEASSENGLRVSPGPVNGGQWPDLRNVDGLGVSASRNGDLDRVSDGDRPAVLDAFVDPSYLSANGWPHPLAGVDFFQHAVTQEDPVAMRQLELMLVGVISGELTLERVHVSEEDAPKLSMENLIKEYRRKGYPGLGEYKVVYPDRGNLVIGLNSPHTLLCPIPFMNEEWDEQLWDELWRKLTGTQDGAPWREAENPASWGEENDLVIRQLRSWIDQRKQYHSGTAPPWTRVFEGRSGDPVPFGPGRLLEVFWGASSDPERPLVELNLPTGRIKVWSPPEGTPFIDEEEFRSKHPELQELSGEDGWMYREVALEVPGREGELHGWWTEHLDALQKQRKVQFWAQDKEGLVILAVMRAGTLHAVRLANSTVLDRSKVAIRSCLPLEQDPVPGSKTSPGSLLYPTLPLKRDFIDLAESTDGRSALELLKRGEPFDPNFWAPREETDHQGRRVLAWNLRCRGRKDPLRVEVCLPGDSVAKAHWMVWPNLRTQSGKGWKAYYAYTTTKFAHAAVDTLWLDAESDRAALRRAEKQVEGKDHSVFPMRYEAEADLPHHAGGPPIAFLLRGKDDEEMGLYPISLHRLAEKARQKIDLAVDFGTSHSVAAVRFGSGSSKVVRLRPELERSGDRAETAMTYHVSESAIRVQAPATEQGVVASGSWMPTYCEGEDLGFIPSELVSANPLADTEADRLAEWIPGTDYRIPSMKVGREDLGRYLLRDFKWDPDNQRFRGSERILREHYLTTFLELALADILVKEARAVPSEQIDVTFTYPLRTSHKEVDDLIQTFERSLHRASRSTGLTLAFHKGVGIYDESRAAQLTSKVPGEVCMVGDLGGGTLDLFISAHPVGDVGFPQVADSARIGGNLLLRHLAASPGRYLPLNGTWDEDAEVKLRAWVRWLGTSSLFGHEANGSRRFDDFEVTGFEKAADAAAARTLIGRYFRFVIEYMARNLTAYLLNHWLPRVDEAAVEQLQISVQLRGNGWRLHYSDLNYEGITQRVSEQVRERVSALWGQVDGHEFPEPDGSTHWAPVARYPVDEPKTAPARSVAGKSMPYQEVKDSWHSHTLVDVQVSRNGGTEEVYWWSQIPFPTGGSDKVHIEHIKPTLVLSSPREDVRFEISPDAAVVGAINDQLETEGYSDEGLYRAPIPAFVWETLFENGALEDK